MKKKGYSMKTNSKKQRDELSSYIEQKLKKIPLNKISKESKFSKRRAKKIRARELLIGFFIMISRRENHSYKNWAIKISMLIKTKLSKQGLWKRMTKNQVIFLKNVLTYILKENIDCGKSQRGNKSRNKFNNILIEDSTVIKLNTNLRKEYPGSRHCYYGRDSSRIKEESMMKIQTTYNITKRKFIRFETTSFRINDQSYSGKILQIARPGDLVIRDLGYFVSKVFKELTQAGIFYISRLRRDVNIYSKESKEEIDLAKMLRKRGTLDIEVFLGKKERMPSRLIAAPVEEKTANQRRRKARENRHASWNKKDLYMLGWELFITNTEREKLNSAEITQLYFLRWRIETIFKTWKSYFRIIDIPKDANVIRTESYIYCMLIYITLFQVYFYNFYLSLEKSKRKGNDTKQISIVKFTQFITSNIELILKDIWELRLPKKNVLFNLIEYFCPYESRKDRVNFQQKLLLLS
jgi:hypothetical protein